MGDSRPEASEESDGGVGGDEKGKESADFYLNKRTKAGEHGKKCRSYDWSLAPPL